MIDSIDNNNMISKEIGKEIMITLNQRMYDIGQISYEIYSKAKAKIEKL